ncbi:hypothetical protein BDC45DRAFT_537265 [Circinella umbellata]|nr:hypothetical protein BDC45DRAFT_537265 [Circinella umbellata]
MSTSGSTANSNLGGKHGVTAETIFTTTTLTANCGDHGENLLTTVFMKLETFAIKKVLGTFNIQDKSTVSSFMTPRNTIKERIINHTVKLMKKDRLTENKIELSRKNLLIIMINYKTSNNLK